MTFEPTQHYLNPIRYILRFFLKLTSYTITVCIYLKRLGINLHLTPSKFHNKKYR